MDSVRRFFTNDNIMLVLVLINTGIIFVSGFMSGHGGCLLIIDSLFTLLFLFEALVKIRVHSFSKYWSDGWNRFDFILVMIALPSCINIFGEIFPVIENDACIQGFPHVEIYSKCRQSSQWYQISIQSFVHCCYRIGRPVIGIQYSHNLSLW